MPVIKSAIKKQRQDKVSEKRNDVLRKNLLGAIKKANKTKAVNDVKKAISLVDKSVKNNLMHKNKGARIKSRLAKLVKIPQKSKAGAVLKKNQTKSTKTVKKAKK